MGQWFVLSVCLMLGSDDFQQRESAQAFLQQEADRNAVVYKRVEGLLQSPDPEVKHRSEQILGGCLFIHLPPEEFFDGPYDNGCFYEFFLDHHSTRTSSRRVKWNAEWRVMPDQYPVYVTGLIAIIQGELSQRIQAGEAPSAARSHIQSSLFRSYLFWKVGKIGPYIEGKKWEYAYHPWPPLRNFVRQTIMANYWWGYD